MSKPTLAEILASRAAIELARVSIRKPHLTQRSERAAAILTIHARNPRAGAIRAQMRSGKLVAYLVAGSSGQVYRVKASGHWPCSCPDHHYSGTACKHALAVWSLWRADRGPSSPAVASAIQRIESASGSRSAA